MHLEASRDSGYAAQAGASARESRRRQDAAHGGGPRQWVPGSAQSFEGSRGQYRGPGPERNRQGGPAHPGPSESSQTRRRAAADQVSHRAASEPAILPGNGRHEVWAAGRRGASQAARLQGNAGNAAHADAREGPGRDSETLSGWARILECVPRREMGTRDTHPILHIYSPQHREPRHVR